MFENLKKTQAEGVPDGVETAAESGAEAGGINDSNCSHDCSSCPSAQGCGSFDPASLIEKTNDYNDIKKVIAVVSGKGGVGKSLVTSLITTTMQRRGHSCAIMDADITGPSIPKIFGTEGMVGANDLGIVPQISQKGIRTISINNLLENDTDPVIWRGPIIAGVVKQFWTDVLWGDIDYLFVDMPPGTGDVALTVFQSLPIDGIIVVTSPQDLVGMIVEKAVNMAEMMQVPVLGIVENMSYLTCPDCGSKIQVFGPSKAEDVAQTHDLDLIGNIPIDPRIAAACDRGMVETLEVDWLDDAADKLETL